MQILHTKDAGERRPVLAHGRIPQASDFPPVQTDRTRVGGRGEDFYALREPLRKRMTGITAEKERELSGQGRQYWDVWNTLICDYARPLGLDLGKHVLHLLEMAPLRALDVGVGNWHGWLEFAAQTGIKISRKELDLYGTSLSYSYVPQELIKRTVLCGAFELDRKFRHGHFGLIVSHHGMHDDEIAGLRAMTGMVGPGGEIVVSFQKKPGLLVEDIRRECPFYEIKDYAHNRLESAYRLIRRE